MLLRLASSNLSLEVAPHQQVLSFVPSNIAFQYPIWLLLVDVRGVTRYAIQIQGCSEHKYKYNLYKYKRGATS